MSKPTSPDLPAPKPAKKHDGGPPKGSRNHEIHGLYRYKRVIDHDGLDKRSSSQVEQANPDPAPGHGGQANESKTSLTLARTDTPKTLHALGGQALIFTVKAGRGE